METSRIRARRPTVLADAAFEELRADLLSDGPLTARGRFVAGELAARLHMSRTPVREALDRLARLGYLEALDGGGYRRRHYRTRDVRDVYELRLLLEPHAAELAAGQALERASSGNAPFHVALAHASGNRVLAHVVELLAERVAAMRTDVARVGRGRARPTDDRESSLAHRRIGGAIVRGDGEAARLAMGQHLTAEARSVLRGLPATNDADLASAAAEW
jgi:DNA-binding GntR family transcriptional regulator